MRKPEKSPSGELNREDSQLANDETFSNGNSKTVVQHTHWPEEVLFHGVTPLMHRTDLELELRRRDLSSPGIGNHSM
jgi:hypothetical protein